MEDKKIRPGSRKKNKSGDPCKDCPAICCHDLAMPLLKPRSRSDLDQIDWYLHFDTVQVYIRSHRWYLLVKGKCIYLDKNFRCSIYGKRADKCRRHSPDTCERNGPYWDVLFTTPEEFRDWWDKHQPKL